MMLIPCPHCGPRAQAEFSYERTADSITRPGDDPAATMQTLYTRTNPRGLDQELWRHTNGCRAWMMIERHRVTHEITSVSAVGPGALP